MTARILALTAAALLSIPPALTAQEPPDETGDAQDAPALDNSPAPEEERSRPAPAWMEGLEEEEDVARFVLMMKVARIAEGLDLSEEETIILMRRLTQHHEELERLQRERAKAFGELKRLLRERASQSALARALETCVRLDQRIAEMHALGLQDVAEGLDIERQARIYVLSREFDERVRQMVERVRQRRGLPGGGMKGPGPNPGRGPGPGMGMGMGMGRPGGRPGRQGMGPREEPPREDAQRQEQAQPDTGE